MTRPPAFAPAFVLALALPLALAAAPALARCPETAEDAKAGFTVTYADGSQSRISLTPEGLTLEEMAYNDGSALGESSVSRHGYLVSELHMTEKGARVPGQTLLRLWPADLLEGPPIAPGARAQVVTTETLDGMDFQMTIILSASADAPALVGDCALTTRRVDIALDPENGDDVDHFLYLPDLGTGFYIGSTGGGLPPLDLRPVRIEVAG
jgi:hypothetical protein